MSGGALQQERGGFARFQLGPACEEAGGCPPGLEGQVADL